MGGPQPVYLTVVKSVGKQSFPTDTHTSIECITVSQKDVEGDKMCFKVQSYLLADLLNVKKCNFFAAIISFLKKISRREPLSNYDEVHLPGEVIAGIVSQPYCFTSSGFQFSFSLWRFLLIHKYMAYVICAKHYSAGLQSRDINTFVLKIFLFNSTFKYPTFLH